MTTKIPAPNLADRFLYLIGKKRGVWMPETPSSGQKKFCYAAAKKENFLNALFRSRKTPLPPGYIDIFDFFSSKDRGIHQ